MQRDGRGMPLDPEASVDESTRPHLTAGLYMYTQGTSIMLADIDLATQHYVSRERLSHSCRARRAADQNLHVLIEGVVEMADHGRSLLWVLTGSDAGGVHAQDDQHTPHQPRVARPIAVDDELLRVLLKPVGLTDHVLCLRRDICVVVSLWDSVGRKKTFASVGE